MQPVTCPFCAGPVAQVQCVNSAFVLVERDPSTVGDFWIDEDGRAHRSDLIPPPDGTVQVVAHIHLCARPWPTSDAFGRQDHQFR